MNKNIYLGFALAACLGSASLPLLAEVTTAHEYPATITEPATSAREHLEPSELQRQQTEHRNKANIPAPSPSIPEILEPSERQRQQAEHDKAPAQ